MSDQQKPKKIPMLLDMPKLRLSAPNPNPAVKGKWATLRYDIYRSNPRIVVDCMDDSMRNRDMDFGRITHTMDPLLFNMYLEQLQRIADGPSEHKEKVVGLGHSYPNGQKSQEITPQTDMWVGKDKDGLVFVSIVNKKDGFPVIKFPFGPSDRRYVQFFHGDGNEFNKSELSILAAKGYVRLLTQVMNNLLLTHYEPPPPPQGGYGGNRGGGGGGYNRPAAGGGQARAPIPPGNDSDFSEIPF